MYINLRAARRRDNFMLCFDAIIARHTTSGWPQSAPCQPNLHKHLSIVFSSRILTSSSPDFQHNVVLYTSNRSDVLTYCNRASPIIVWYIGVDLRFTFVFGSTWNQMKHFFLLKIYFSPSNFFFSIVFSLVHGSGLRFFETSYVESRWETANENGIEKNEVPGWFLCLRSWREFPWWLQ